jgi:hypothetical protein
MAPGPCAGLVIAAWLGALLLGAAPAPARGDAACRFALDYTAAQLFSDAAAREQFVMQWLQGEAQFMRRLGTHAPTGLTLDGQRLDVDSGLPFGPPHMFTAPSKESLHVAILARVLYGDPRAQALYSVDEALALLAQKAASYAKFFAKYPGFAGFLPWVQVDDAGNVDPTPDFVNRVPALDNGELFWPAFAVAEVLRQSFPAQGALQQQWQGIWESMATNAVDVFYAGDGNVRTVAFMTNQSLPMGENNYTSSQPCGDPCYLNDPYEGELFVAMMYLFSDLPDADRQLLWQNKLPRIQPVALQLPQLNASILVQRGWWFSAHENWKYLMLPYTLSPTNARVFLNMERARTWYAAALAGSPGLWASVTGTALSNNDSLPYFSDCGVPPLAFQNDTHQSLVTPYGAFNLILASPPHGIVWLHNMISARRGQNCFGTTEALDVSGAAVSPITTWDSKITSVAAALGGVADLTATFLQTRGLLDDFVKTVEAVWSSVFALPLPGEQLDFALPQTAFPQLLPDFASCSRDSPPCFE